MKRILIFIGLKIVELSIGGGMILLFLQFKWFQRFMNSKWPIPLWILLLIFFVALVYLVVDNWKTAGEMSQ